MAGLAEGRPPVIGIAGGIGSGKSAVAEALAELGCAVCDSDAEVRRALATPQVRDLLVSWWGEGVLDEGGGIDRSAVAKIIFKESEQRERLEGLLHPMVHEARRRCFDAAVQAGARGLVIDAPLLFEAGLDAECDAVVFVDTPREVRLARVSASRGWTEADLDRREQAQMPVDEKRGRSGYIIMNSGDRTALRHEVGRVFERILREHGPPGTKNEAPPLRNER